MTEEENKLHNEKDKLNDILNAKKNLRIEFMDGDKHLYTADSVFSYDIKDIIIERIHYIEKRLSKWEKARKKQTTESLIINHIGVIEYLTGVCEAEIIEITFKYVEALVLSFNPSTSPKPKKMNAYRYDNFGRFIDIRTFTTNNDELRLWEEESQIKVGEKFKFKKRLIKSIVEKKL